MSNQEESKSSQNQRESGDEPVSEDIVDLAISLPETPNPKHPSVIPWRLGDFKFSKGIVDSLIFCGLVIMVATFACYNLTTNTNNSEFWSHVLLVIMTGCMAHIKYSQEYNNNVNSNNNQCSTCAEKIQGSG